MYFSLVIGDVGWWFYMIYVMKKCPNGRLYQTTNVIIYVHVWHIWECKIVKSKCNGLIFLVTVQTILVSLCHVIQMSRPGIDCNDNKC